jgi:predicted ATPase/class 3 adenylate cyclase
MRRELPSGTVTFLFTDIEGSTRLLHALGPDAYAEALAEHRRALRTAFGEHQGVEVDTQGDAFFVAFPTVGGAVAAAQAAQHALAAGPIRVRMGLHTGTPTLTAEGYVGVDVHRGARVAALAHGGQVLLTEPSAALVDAGTTVSDLGRHRLKDFDGPVRLLQLGTDAFPPLRSPGTVRLPTPATPFVGREHELFAAVSLVLEHDPPILSVIGAGGAGKTRFVIELARLLSENADGGTVFVPLAAARHPELGLRTLAEAIGAERAEPDAIAARVSDRRTHVVLDNVEQLLPDLAALLAQVVAETPSLRLLVTSREALRVGAETRFELAPLAPEEAVELFLARARAVRPEIEPSPAVTRLCERLDFLPLALELAAARTSLLAPEALLERLGARLDLPAPRDADPRHATLRTTIAWSFELLSADEQRLFARLAVFPAGSTIEAAEIVCDADLDGLASLIDKSLVRRRVEPNGRDRLWMLETIHDFARDRLAELPDAAELHRRHASWILELARSAHLSMELAGTQDFEAALSERDGIRSAVDWATEHDAELAGDIVLALEHFWTTTAPAEGRPRVEALLDRASDLPDDMRARLLRLHGGIVLLSGEVDLGEERYRQALAIFEELGDATNVVGLLSRFAVHSGWRDEPEETRRLVAEVRALNEGVGNPIVEPQMMSTLGRVAIREGDLETALELSRRAIAAAKDIDFELWRLWELDSQLELELSLGLLDDAERTGREGLELARRLDDRRLTASLLTGLALVALRRGDEERAGTLWGAVVASQRENGVRHSPEQATFAAPLAGSTSQRFLEAVEDGRLVDLEQASSIALREAQTEP